MSEGDKILAAALVTCASVLVAVMKQSVLLRSLIDTLGESISISMAKHSKWECKYRGEDRKTDGPQKPSGTP